MAIKIAIPTPLRRITGDADTVEVSPGTINEMIESVETRYPGFRARLCEDSGALRRFINIYVNGEDVRFLDNLATRVTDGAE
ncbi:MAG TPA: MoaD/ThiS family protein, partial [Blastocatellia bacterium]|nr:MoaD/ThiS family protein [Blastocatellia bacterium]